MRDRHCHIVFGVDDGARSFEESCAMLQAAKDAGVSEIVATPHMRWRNFDRQLVEQNFALVRQRAAELGIAMSLGFEVYYPRLCEIGFAHASEFVCKDTGELIVEFDSGGRMTFGWERGLYDIQCACGAQLVIAHPERYIDVQEDFSTMRTICDLGCKVQVSAGDLLGGPFGKCARTARRIMSEGLCDQLVSDAHRPAHYGDFSRASRKWG